MKEEKQIKNYITYCHKVHNKVFCYRIYKEALIKEYEMYLAICDVKGEKPKSKITLIRKAIQEKIIENLEKSFNNR